jgi:hypothetical protein
MFIAVTGPIAGAVVGGLMNSGSNGGGGSTQTVDKSPWAAAVPWLTANLGTGQNLQNYYQANPFNGIQQASYGNLLAGNDYINQMMPGLLSQFSQPQGFDRNNPRARPQAIQFPAMQQYQQQAPQAAAPQGNYQPTAGLLGGGGSSSGQMGTLTGGMNVSQNPFANGLMPAPAPAPVAAAPAPMDYLTYINSLGGGSGGY